MSVLALALCTGFSSAEIADFVHPYVDEGGIADSAPKNNADPWNVWDALTPSFVLKWRAISGAPPVQEMECADTSLLLQQ